MIKKVDNISNLKVYPSIFFSKYGSTCLVYKINPYEVIKLYRETENKRMFFKYRDMYLNLCRLSNIKSNSFVTPNDIYIDNDSTLLGYSMDYIKGRYLNKLDSDMFLSDLIDEVKKLDQENKSISKDNYSIFDLNERNILFSKDGFKIIDLDGGLFKDNKSFDEIYEENSKLIKKAIVKGLYGINSQMELISLDPELMEYYYESSLVEMIEYIKSSCDSRYPTVNDAKTLLRRKFDVYDKYKYYGRN